MFKSIKKFFSPDQTVLEVPTSYRVNMWVMVNNRIAILTSLTNPCEVHYVDAVSGETVGVDSVPLSAIRQAKWIEIPEKRRNITEEKGRELGYGA